MHFSFFFFLNQHHKKLDLCVFLEKQFLGKKCFLGKAGTKSLDAGMVHHTFNYLFLEFPPGSHHSSSPWLHLLNGTSDVSISGLSCPTEEQASGNAARNVNMPPGCSSPHQNVVIRMHCSGPGLTQCKNKTSASSYLTRSLSLCFLTVARCLFNVNYWRQNLHSTSVCIQAWAE